MRLLSLPVTSVARPCHRRSLVHFANISYVLRCAKEPAPKEVVVVVLCDVECLGRSWRWKGDGPVDPLDPAITSDPQPQSRARILLRTQRPAKRSTVSIIQTCQKHHFSTWDAICIQLMMVQHLVPPDSRIASLHIALADKEVLFENRAHNAIPRLAINSLRLHDTKW
jgi:hypothetical protein